MYRQLFGFKKNPFKQPTDHERLFLGRHHEEALAHLTYAVMECEGFSVVTGESGVGKTTVCRSFLERLDQEVVAAYIAAMTGLGPLQLLKAINAEFKARSDVGTIKDLTDALNAFLIQKKLEGRKVALFIDDAQLLSTAALEQVRLLSNLETTRDKLLQIVLIGRPALSKMLGAPSLRQIGQRVSVNYFISPLDYEETVAYIQHRISISSTGPPVRFDQAAIRPVYKFTKGIPRKINIACDRILTTAYKYRERTVTKKTVKDVLRQWHKGPDPALYYLFRQKLPAIAIAGVLMLAAVASSMYLFGGKKTESPTVAIGPKTDRPAPLMPSQPPSAPAQAESVATTAPPEKMRPAEPAQKKSVAAVDQPVPLKPSQPPSASAQAETVATTPPPEKMRPAEPAQKKSEVAVDQPAPRKPSQPPSAPVQAETVATTAAPEKMRPTEPAQKKSAAAVDQPAPRKPSQPPPAPVQAETVATTAAPEKMRPAEPAQKKSAAAVDQPALRKPSQPPPAPVPAETVATTPPPEKMRPAELAQKKGEAAKDKGQLLAVLDSLRLQHNLDQVEATAAVGSEPSAELTYSVQVGAFLLSINAQQRVNQLKSKGYTPRIIAVTDPQGRIWFTVRIGDFQTLEQAQKQADEFTAREKKASVVRPYNLY
jgi:type II secretory pathway predicted ATPase ExeA